ncbi:tripartite tricarboxylate transporter TctB family protein [Tropicimonas marinistellae]|uniref:tripartite tricarboxylate transporter TctB family protein n=1 Tax=Tropicimonas marinistellae TaxID=1739787 RepID=UPI0008355A62|nr:tripartite tricarboxylate transporter TctB family protein [Tropicimonas marinistellae]
MQHIDPEHHDGTSDATPGGELDKRRPGELAFAAFLLLASLGLLWSAFGIENPFGPNGLSSPRSIPVATTLAMAVAAAIVFLTTVRLPLDNAESFAKDILPGVVLLFVVFLVAYGLLLRPLGFLPTSALFLVASIKILAKRGWLWTLGVSLGSLLVIWLIFRIVFTVLMPAGIVPEAEFIQFFRGLSSGGAEQ